ncbi:MAG: tail fiber domain-containing protein [Phycisphaerales bacterium]|nr:tail fiber domain-containing protein [Phycisphaerales bacterium]
MAASARCESQTAGSWRSPPPRPSPRRSPSARLATNGTWSSTSDARLKREIHAAHGHLDAVLGLRPVRFHWTTTGETDVGLLAQEVRPLLPHLVTGDESTGYLSIDYARLSVTAVGAIQEQQAQIESLQAEIRELRAALKRLEAELVAPAARAP